MKAKKAKRHLEPWSIQESTQFLNLYLDGVKQRDVTVLCDEIASTLERTYDAIKLRRQEVVSILSDAVSGLKKEKQTPHMIEAVQSVSEDRGITRAKMLYWFEN
jgi:hypothetical protein